MAAILSDIRHSLRLLKKSPLFTSIAIASLGLGLGANTAIFSVLDQVLLRPLPVKDPRELVLLKSPGANRGSFNGDSPERLFSRPMYLEIRDRNQVFSGVIARAPVSANLVYQGQSESVAGEIVSGNFFDVLGIVPERGRLLSSQDDLVKNGHPVVVLGYTYWMRRFGGDPKVIGQKARVNDSVMTIVGVAPRGFFGVDVGRVPDIFVPLAMKAKITPTRDEYDARGYHFLHVLARLKPGVSLKQANAAMQVIYKPMLEADMAAMEGGVSSRFRERFIAKSLIPVPAYNGVPTFRESTGTPLYVLMAMVGLVLLIACANVANLLVARGLGRQKEVAIRLALGAARKDVVRQLLAESVVLSILGACAGLLVSAWTSALLVQTIPGEDGMHGLTSTLDLRTVAFTFAVALFTGIAFGLLPALQSTRPNIYPTLKAQGGSIIGGLGQLRSRQTLVVAQVALSLLLLVGAGLFTRSLINLRKLDPGFQTSNMASFAIDASRNGYTPQRIFDLYQRIQDRLASIPGVKSAALSEALILTGDNGIATIHVDGYKAKQDEDMNPHLTAISPGFFPTIGIPMLMGRDFNAADRLGGPEVAIVNESFAKYFFKNENPIGRKFATNGGEGPGNIEIVGVAKDAKYDSLRENKLRFFYVPYMQDPRIGYMGVDVRTAGAPEAVMPAIRHEIAQIDPTLALWDFKTMETQVNESLFAERMIATLCASFGVLATLLASIGLYGVMAFSVARRTREIGIRMALGAGRVSVVGMVLKEVSWMCLIGIGAGIPLSIGVSRYIASQLYGVTPTDLLTLTFAALTMMVVSALAGFLPARRAATIDPTVALRYE